MGERGHSKDHRPDLKQMVVGAVIDGEGRPVCCEMWPGNMSDAKTLMPVVDRMRNEKAVRDDVLSHPGRFRKVDDNLQMKEVGLDGRRYVVCFNPNEAKKDAAERETILASLKEKLKQGAKSLVGNRGYRKYLEVKTGTVTIDRSKVESEARYDGKYVLVTNLPPDFETSDVALRYRELLQVENLFRALKSALRTRPIYHQNESAIKGHIFCNFLALMLLKELQLRLQSKGWKLEWDESGAIWKRFLKSKSRNQVILFIFAPTLSGSAAKFFRRRVWLFRRQCEIDKM